MLHWASGRTLDGTPPSEACIENMKRLDSTGFKRAAYQERQTGGARPEAGRKKRGGKTGVSMEWERETGAGASEKTEAAGGGKASKGKISVVLSLNAAAGCAFALKTQWDAQTEVETPDARIAGEDDAALRQCEQDAGSDFAAGRAALAPLNMGQFRGQSVPFTQRHDAPEGNAITQSANASSKLATL